MNRRRRRRPIIKPKNKNKRKRKRRDNNKVKRKRRKIQSDLTNNSKTNEQKIRSINRFKSPNLGDLYLGLHGINPIDDSFEKYESHIPEKNSSNVDNLILHYKNDFGFRLFRYPEQLMFISKQVGLKSKYSNMTDPVLDEKTNRLQIEFFTNFKKNIINLMKFPKDSDRKVSKDVIKLIANNLHEHVKMSQTSYAFRYAILKLIQINSNARNLIKQMIPKIKFETLMFLLNNTMQSKNSVGIENQTHEENNPNIIIDYILTISWAYSMNFGLLIEEGKDPIRLSNTLNKLQQK